MDHLRSAAANQKIDVSFRSRGEDILGPLVALLLVHVSLHHTCGYKCLECLEL